MSKSIRKLRGVVGLGLTWGILWAGLFLLMVAIIGLFRPGDIDRGEGPLDVLPVGALVGVVSGVVFGAMLAVAENGKAVTSLSRGRVAMWGILGSAVFPLATGRPEMVIILCPISAAIAVTLVALARRAVARDDQRRGAIGGYVLQCVRDAVEPVGA